MHICTKQAFCDIYKSRYNTQKQDELFAGAENKTIVFSADLQKKACIFGI